MVLAKAVGVSSFPASIIIIFVLLCNQSEPSGKSEGIIACKRTSMPPETTTDPLTHVVTYEWMVDFKK